MKSGAKDHIKVKRLKRLLGIPLYQAVGILETLYQVCTQSADDGGIGRYCDSDIALELEWEDDPKKLIQALMDAGFIDECPVNRLAVHDWADHAPDFIKDRLRKRVGASTASRNTESNSEDARNSGGDSGASRNSTGDSALTKHSTAQHSTAKPSRDSGRRRNRDGALASLVTADLLDTGKVLDWFAARFPDRQSEDRRLFALACAECSLRGNRRNSPGFFAHVVAANDGDSLSQGDWDRASQRMHLHVRGSPQGDVAHELAATLSTKEEP